MTDDQRQQCEEAMSQVRAAGYWIALREFSSVSGFRVIAGDGDTRRIERDGTDPLRLIHEVKRLCGIKDPPQADPPATSPSETEPPESVPSESTTEASADQEA